MIDKKYNWILITITICVLLKTSEIRQYFTFMIKLHSWLVLMTIS